MWNGWIVVFLGFLVACGDGGSSTPVDSPAPDDGPAPDTATCVPDTGPATVVFLNRGGGTYTSGTADDSSNNVSVVIPANMSPLTLAAPTVMQADWDAFRACLEDRFAPFNVTFTETDPGTAEHQELLVIDTSNQIGAGNGVTAVSPVVPCEPGTNAPVPVAKGITYVTWAPFGTVPMANVARCEVAAQAIAATFGLDHAFSCPDLMTFLTGCGAKSFTDMDVACGEGSARACRCGGNTQNSFQYLAQLLGRTCE